jgi:hypothetical protein
MLSISFGDIKVINPMISAEAHGWVSKDSTPLSHQERQGYVSSIYQPNRKDVRIRLKCKDENFVSLRLAIIHNVISVHLESTAWLRERANMALDRWIESQAAFQLFMISYLPPRLIESYTQKIFGVTGSLAYPG